MAGGREIKTKIKSVQNTRKVTRALEMVSASKIRKAQERMKASRPYARAMKQVIGHLAQANSEYQHPFLVERADDQARRLHHRVDRPRPGGGLNTNLFRKLLADIREWQAARASRSTWSPSARRPRCSSAASRSTCSASVTHLGDKPHVEQLVGVIKVMLDAYPAGTVDQRVPRATTTSSTP